MKGTITLSGNNLKIKSSRLPLGILTSTGGIMFLAGLSLMGTMTPLDHILFGMGMSFTAGGLFMLINSRYYKISFNEEKGFISILDSSVKTITPLRIPLEYYSWITIQKKIGTNNGGHEVSLMNERGASVHLADFENMALATDFARRLQELLGMDILVEDESLRRIETGKNKNTQTIESCAIGDLGIDVTEDGASTTFSWKGGYRIYHYLLMASVLYGFFHLIHFVVLPIQDIDILKILLYGFIAFLMFLLALIFLSHALGRHFLTIGPAGVTYYLKILGKWLRYREIGRGDIAMIRNSLTMTEDTLNIVTKRGLDILVNLSSELKNSDGTPSLNQVSRAFGLRHEIIQIDITSLNIAERFCIEQKIMNIL